MLILIVYASTSHGCGMILLSLNLNEQEMIKEAKADAAAGDQRSWDATFGLNVGLRSQAREAGYF